MHRIMGYKEVNFDWIIDEASESSYEIGREIREQKDAGVDIQSDLDPQTIVKLFRKFFYAGIEGRKFLFVGFPDRLELIQTLERDCAKVTAVILAGKFQSDNGLSKESIDTLLLKENRLKHMSKWDEGQFNEHFGN